MANRAGGSNGASLVRRVATAICAAAHDLELEQERKFEVLHFLDTDFLTSTVFGYRGSDVTSMVRTGNHFARMSQRMPRGIVERPGTGRTEFCGLFSAILNFGLESGLVSVPKFRVLQPHLAEWTFQLTGPGIKRKPGGYQQAVDALGVQAALAELADVVNRGQALTPEVYVSALTDTGPELFVAFDLLAEDDRARSLRLMDGGLKEPTPFDFGDSLLSGPLVARVESVLSRYRFGEQEVKQSAKTARSHMNDVVALASLVKAVEGRSEERSTTIVRFYSETSSLRESLVGDEWLRSATTYTSEHVDDPWPHEVHSVLRDEYYYLVRLLVPSLSFDLDRARMEPEFAAEIIEVASAIRVGDDEHLFEVLADLEGGSGGLAAVIDEMTSLRFLEKVWPEWLAGYEPRLAEKVEIGAMPFDALAEYEEEHRAAIDGTIRQRVEEVEDRAQAYFFFTEIYSRTYSKVLRRMEELRSLALNDEALADALGLTRFGIVAIEDHVVDEASAILSSLDGPNLEGDNDANGATAAHVAQEIARAAAIDVEHPHRALAAAAILFSLFADAAASQVAEALARALNDASEGDTSFRREERLAASSLAAISRFHASLTRSRQMSSAEEVVALLAAAERQFLASMEVLGEGETAHRLKALILGRLRFDAWHCLNPLGAAGGHVPTAGSESELLVAAFGAVDPDLLTTVDHVYPWLVNFLLYAAALGRVDEPLEGSSVHDLADALTELRSTTTLGTGWSYRFADTLAVYYQKRAEVARPKSLEVAKKFAEAAERWSELACADGVLDQEITSHRERIKALQLRLAGEEAASL